MANDIYQAKYEHLLMDANQLDASGNPSAKLAELKGQILAAGDSATTHAFPAGTSLASAGTGNATSTVLKSFGRWFTNDILLRIVTTVGATPTAKFDIKAAPPGGAFANINYGLIATPNTLVATQITIIAAATNVYRIPMSSLFGQSQLEVVISANTNVTYTIDAYDFGGIPTA